MRFEEQAQCVHYFLENLFNYYYHFFILDSNAEYHRSISWKILHLTIIRTLLIPNEYKYLKKAIDVQQMDQTWHCVYRYRFCTYHAIEIYLISILINLSLSYVKEHNKNDKYNDMEMIFQTKCHLILYFCKDQSLV